MPKGTTRMTARVLLIPLAPLAGAVVLVLGGRWIGSRAHRVRVTAAGLAFAAALSIVPDIAREPPFVVTLYDWLLTAPFRLPVTLLVDRLTVVMLLLVTGVGFLIHVYAVGYMHRDPGYARFFAYLNLFIFAMTMLVLAGNYVLLYVFWEAVGLASYLLIGFWHERPRAAAAATKAFVVNRIGDVGFLLGIFWIATAVGTVDYGEVFGAAGALPVATANGISLLLFLGAIGKSAQLPLHVWLPDAMEGPTPVSALIHAATMVTAGVYMVARSHVLFERSGVALEIVAWVGAVTALFAATVATAQTDIKRVLAYSTISQLGLMFLGLGAGAYAAGIFHLLTQGFFKALLFLGAGSVIHALGGEQSLERMGGLAPRLRVTALTFLVGAATMAGLPPFSGFFSKDAILAGAFEHGSPALWIVGTATAFVTAFYSLRVALLAFFGAPRGEPAVLEHAHESPPVMTGPLAILALAAAGAGILGVPGVEGVSLARFLAPVFHETSASASPSEWLLMAVSAMVAVVASLAASWIYLRPGPSQERIATKLRPLRRLLAEGYYIDRLYGVVVVAPLRKLAEACWRSVDDRAVDGAVNGIGRAIEASAQILRRLQTGFVVNYLLAILVGAVAMVALFLLRS